VQQWPLVQLCAVVHVVPHFPQLALSVIVSAQFEEQHAPCPQSVPHVPQCV
jgi:hypothetical protein